LENVDRLLKSPISHRGRDFAIILSCFARLGYRVEGRIVNAADYGFPQRGRRVFIVASHERGPQKRKAFDPTPLIYDRGVLAKALPVWPVGDLDRTLDVPDMTLGEPDEVTATFWASLKFSPFRNAGVMWRGEVWSRNVESNYDAKFQTLA